MMAALASGANGPVHPMPKPSFHNRCRSTISARSHWI